MKRIPATLPSGNQSEQKKHFLVRPPRVLGSSSSLSDGYRLSKSIDDYQGEGTYLLAARRVSIHYIRDPRPTYYESLTTYDQLLHIVQHNMHLRQLSAPFSYWGNAQIAIRLFESVYTAPKGILSLPEPGEREQGNHAVAFFGTPSSDNQSIPFQNTWGINWGDRGYGVVSREYISRFMTDAFVWYTAHFMAHTRAYTSYKKLNVGSEEEILCPAPFLQNISRFRERGFTYYLCNYQVVSIITGRVITVIEIQNETGLRLAWAYLLHPGDATNDVFTLTEFYVWPKFRCRGYGARLEEAAATIADQHGGKTLRFMFHYMDARPHVRESGVRFSTRCGYTLQWRRQTLPSIFAIGEKNL